MITVKNDPIVSKLNIAFVGTFYFCFVCSYVIVQTGHVNTCEQRKLIIKKLFFQIRKKVFRKVIEIPMELDPEQFLENLFFPYHKNKQIKKNKTEKFQMGFP